MLPESSGYPGFPTGREFLRYYARLYGLSSGRAVSIADSLLAEVGLDEQAGPRISSYSRGMRQQLGIARALVNDPAVVFLDEPNLGLDPAGQSQVLEIIRRIAQRDVTVVLSTHTLPEVEELCSQLLILNEGRLVASGAVNDVMRAAIVERAAQIRVPTNLIERARQAIGELPASRLRRSTGGQTCCESPFRPERRHLRSQTSA